MNERVSYHSNLEFPVEEDDICILDESDRQLYQAVVLFYRFVMANRVICLTGTPLEERENGIESAIVAEMGFKQGTYWPIGNTRPSKPLPDRTIDLTTNDDFKIFITSELRSRAVLIYCHDELLQFFQESGLGPILVQETTDPELLRNLDEMKNKQFYHLVVVNQPWAMRGVDYRAPSAGITLLIARQFETTRDATQGLARVGRLGDPCLRLIVSGLSLVDDEK